MAFMRNALHRRAAQAGAIYLVTTLVYLAFAPRSVLVEHTPYNHFALLAEAWLEGRLDLGGPPPAYTHSNDFARFEDDWFVAFPPFPAVVLLPFVALAGSAEGVCDGQVFLWLAGLGPALLFLCFEKLRMLGRPSPSSRGNMLLALLFAFGTVYFFCAEQGTVWFAAHIVSVLLTCAFVWCSLDAAHPALAGTALGLAIATRTPLAFAALFFVGEALVRCHDGGGAFEFKRCFRQVDKWSFFKLLGWFAAPLSALLALLLFYNWARFDSPLDFGYEHLQIRWQARIEKWGLFSYHYLAKNLGVISTSLPYVGTGSVGPAFQINGHGLALWVTTPLYLWLLWPRTVTWFFRLAAVTVLVVALPTLFYQNTGWVQFGYRFSNDYAPFLFLLLASGGYRFQSSFAVAATWSVLINSFGAATFGRPEFSRYYFVDPTQRILYQPD